MNETVMNIVLGIAIVRELLKLFALYLLPLLMVAAVVVVSAIFIVRSRQMTIEEIIEREG
jgi:hypothetical protein